MVKIVTSVIINKPPEKVFPLVADIKNFPKWFPWISEAAKTSSPPYGVGSTEYEIVGRFYFIIPIKNISTVTEFQQNKKISRSIESPHFIPWFTTYNCESVEEGTRLTYILRWEPEGLLKLITPFVATLFTIMDQKIPLLSLKHYLESERNNSS
jgi:ribosome-associated toxin RatA of RatAB toxin-antitoxin module